MRKKKQQNQKKRQGKQYQNISTSRSTSLAKKPVRESIVKRGERRDT